MRYEPIYLMELDGASVLRDDEYPHSLSISCPKGYTHVLSASDEREIGLWFTDITEVLANARNLSSRSLSVISR